MQSPPERPVTRPRKSNFRIFRRAAFSAARIASCSLTPYFSPIPIWSSRLPTATATQYLRASDVRVVVFTGTTFKTTVSKFSLPALAILVVFPSWKTQFQTGIRGYWDTKNWWWNLQGWVRWTRAPTAGTGRRTAWRETHIAGKWLKTKIWKSNCLTNEKEDIETDINEE